MRGVLLACLVLALAATPASATSTYVGYPFGQGDETPGGLGAASGGTSVQSDSAAGSPTYVLPVGGVITGWAIDAGGNDGQQARLRVFRGADFALAASSALETLPLERLNGLFTRLVVAPGDRIGLSVSGVPDSFGASIDDRVRRWAGDPSGPPGAVPVAGRLLNVGAVVESDADGDGLGDDTQDGDDNNDGAPDAGGQPGGGGGAPGGGGSLRDSDRDGLPDVIDPDDDNDGFPDSEDAFPLDATRAVLAAGGARVSRRTLKLDRRGRVPLRVSCARAAPGACRGRLTLETARRVEVARKRRVRLGGARYSAAPGRSTTVRLRLSRTGRALMRRSRKLRVRATLRGGGDSVRTTLTLRR